ncbi:peroxisomal d3,d2-enoyl-CoA isomerase [Tothia fuscella]|uniref:Peroxisomal d3,d2-enoyl-CoA isomerase n=1 Tax=Tothia fuscella TaxID=1048955 RepID=A0A9P4TT25_9PEZI|nr:peroxisomal d3,d2-enoyl-CoA isomerase [Tothia fuscella]
MGNYTDIIMEKKGQIGIIKFNRPKALNSFGGTLMQDIIGALREFNEDPDTVFTVITGEGRFFSAGADVKGANLDAAENYSNPAEKKLVFLARFVPALEMMRSMIDHKKVLVLALNGPGVGGGAAWFQGVCDIFLAAEGSWLQVPFSALGLVPENGSATSFAQHIGIHRANDFLMFGRKLTATELESWGLVNRVFPAANFQKSVEDFLNEQLSVNDGKSMMETKRLQNASRRDERIISVYNSVDALAERFVADAPAKRFAAKKAELDAKSKSKI